MPRANLWTRRGRLAALVHLQASVGHLETSTREQFAQELVVLGLDVLPERMRAAVLEAARRELAGEEGVRVTKR